MQRPCPYVGCKYHLALDTRNETLSLVGSRSIDLSRGRGGDTFDAWSDGLVATLEEMPETCALDVTDAGALNLSQIGKLLKLCRERVRQIEEKGLSALEVPATIAGIAIGGNSE